MGKVNNLPSMPSPSPSLLADIIQARTNIKKKYNALKTGRFETESIINNTLGSIIDPLNKIRDNINTSRTHSSSHPPPPPSASSSSSSSRSPSPSPLSSRQSSSQSLPDIGKKQHSTASSSASLSRTTYYEELNEVYSRWPKSELDKLYGPIKLTSGEFALGDKEIKFVDNKLHIEDDDYLYSITPGLIELLFAKSPATNKYTQNDLKKYKRILIQTSAHRTADGTRIRTSIGAKYMKVISKLFADKNSKTGSGINMRFQKHNIVYWNDPNELVDRLRLLYSSLAAGNTGVRNEIISICSELVEAGILKTIPNV